MTIRPTRSDLVSTHARELKAEGVRTPAQLEVTTSQEKRDPRMTLEDYGRIFYIYWTVLAMLLLVLPVEAAVFKRNK